MDDYAKLFLDKSNLGKYFVDYIGTTSHGISKAEAIKKMVSRNNINSACYIGDIKKDMEASKEANIDFIHARYGFEPNLECQYHIDDITQLKNLL